MAQQIEVGSVVELRSFSPLMIVVRIWKDHEGPMADCTWFNGGKTETAAFPLAALEFKK